MRSPVTPWQVWWVDLDPATGREQRKKRPAIVVSTPFHLRLVRQELLTVVPLTTVERPGWIHRPEVTLAAGKQAWAITEQMRTISARRIDGVRPIGTLDADQIEQVRGVLRRMVDF